MIYSLLLTVLLAQEADETRFVTRPIRGVVRFENGQPAAGFRVYAVGERAERKPKETVTSERGTFTLRVRPGVYKPTIYASSPDGEMLGHFAAFKRARLLKITVRPKHTVNCIVRDKNGKPLPDADVVLISNYSAVATAKADQNGKCSFDIPSHLPVELIHARKDGHGFDYYEHYTMWPASSPELPPENVELKLQGATTCRVKLVDRNGNPVAGVPVLPWTITRPRKITYANLSGSPSISIQTDKDGVAMFRWLPVDSERQITFLVADDIHYIQQDLMATRLNDEIQTTVYRRVRVSGTVRHKDGSPAAGINLQGESLGGGNYFRGYTKTNSKGEYHFDIYPNLETSIEVTDDRWAAKAQSVSLQPGQTKQGLDFKLIGGATLKGTITSADGSEIGPDVHATVISSGRVVRWLYANADGYYSAQLGPGTYTVTLPGSSEQKSITVKDGEEVVLNGTVPKTRQSSDFVGVVVDDENKPVTSAEVYAAGTNAGRVSHSGRTNSKGEFRLHRQGPTVFMCCHPSRPLAAIEDVPLDEGKRTFKLAPAATVTGQLLSEDGKTPVAHSRINLQVTHAVFQPFTVSTWTDATGKFRLVAPPKTTGSLELIYTIPGNGPDEVSLRKMLEIDDITFEKAELQDLGVVKVEGAKDTRPR